MGIRSDDRGAASSTLLEVLGIGGSADRSWAELQLLQASFGRMFDALPLNLLIKDAQGRRVLANRPYLELHGTTLEAILGKNDFELFPVEQARKIRAADEEVLRTGRAWRGVEQNRAADGIFRWIECIRSPVCDTEGRVVGVQVMFWNVSEKKQTEIALDRERYLMHALLDNIPDSIYFKDEDSRFVRISASMAEKFRLANAADAIGKSDADIFTATHAEQARADEVQVMTSGQAIVALVERETWPNRDDTWCSTTKMPLRDSDGKTVGTFGISRDITDIIRAEESLARERDLLRTLMDHLPDLVFVKDCEGRFVTVNSSIVKLYDAKSRDEIIGRTDADFVDAELAHAFAVDDQRVMQSGQTLCEHEESHFDPEGKKISLLTTKVPLKNTAGEVVGLVGICRDITKRKRAEEAAQESRRAAEAANRAKSDFLANMSHEIRTPMNAIIGMAELLLDTQLTTTQREYLSMVLESGESLLSLLNDILDFSKIEAGKLELERAAFEIRESLGDTLKSLGLRAHAKGLELAYDIDSAVPTTLVGDVGRLRQIVVNLVGNAIKFTERGEVVLSVTCKERTDDAVILHISVSDTGIGIPADKCERIFHEFEQADTSTTRRYGGTGLGLAISSRLVELMGGNLHVTSEEGRGSTFSFDSRLQIADQSPDRAGRTVTLNELPVLVVDDNATNRRILFEMLCSWGMKPTLAPSAREAFDILQQAQRQQSPYRLLLLDVNMPEIDGFELSAWVRDQRDLSEIPIVMLTSSGRPGDVDRRATLNIAASLLKPVKQSELLAAIVEVVGAVPTECEPALPRCDRQAPEGRLRILLAEDNRVNQKLALGVLEGQGHQVTIAVNGCEAISAWQSQTFDLILMDVQMPEMDGLQATRAIRELEAGTSRHIPIIAMTAHAMRGDQERCLEAGMDDYLSKPIRIGHLTEKLAAIVTAKGVSQSIATAAPDPESLVDWLAAIEATGGDHDLLLSVIEEFFDESTILMEQIRGGVQHKDLRLLSRSAHSLKGAMLSVGATRPSSLAFKLERMGMVGDLTTAEETLVELERQYEALVPALKRGPAG